MMTVNEYKKIIRQHLEKYDKVQEVDTMWVEKAAFALHQLSVLEEDILNNGSTQEKNGYSQVRGELTAHKTFMQEFNSCSVKLGLSPTDREKLKWEVKQKKDDNSLLR